MSRREVARTEIRLSEGIPWKRRTRQAAERVLGYQFTLQFKDFL